MKIFCERDNSYADVGNIEEMFPAHGGRVLICGDNGGVVITDEETAFAASPKVFVRDMRKPA